jgi:maltose phosphorylase
VHSILAAKLGRVDKAVEMYLRTARLDLDDYNAEAYQGLHITSMAGTWMSIVEGFGGFRVKDGVPHFDALLPEQWDAFSFKLRFRNRTLKVVVNSEGTEVIVLDGEPLDVSIDGKVSRA